MKRRGIAKAIVVWVFFFMLPVLVYSETEDKERGTKSKRYILSPNIGYEYYHAGILYGVSINTGIIGCDFVYLGPSGFTLYADAEIIFGTSVSRRTSSDEIIKKGTGGINLDLFLGYSWEFNQKHKLGLAGGPQFSFASEFDSYGLGARLSYSYEIIEKIGIMATSTGSISVNFQKTDFGEFGIKSNLCGIGRFALKLGPYFQL